MREFCDEGERLGARGPLGRGGGWGARRMIESNLEFADRAETE